MPFIGSLEGTFGYGRGGSEPLNNNKLLVEGATYIPTSNASNMNIQIYKLTVDSQNNIYVIGRYRSQFTPLTLKNMSGYTQTNSSWTLPITSLSNGEFYIIKYDINGVVQWALNISNTINPSQASDLTTGIITDSSNNLYITNIYRGNVISGDPGLYINEIFNGAARKSSFYIPAATKDTGFVIKYNSSGNAVWVTYVKPSISSSSSIARCHDICILGSLVYVCGVYNSSSRLNNNTVLGNVSGNTAIDSDRQLLGCVDNSAFVACWNTSGAAQYATIIRTVNSTASLNDNVTPLTISTDGSSIYIGGRFDNRSLSLSININKPSSNNISQVDTTNPRYLLPITTTGAGFLVKYTTGLAPTAVSYISNNPQVTSLKATTSSVCVALITLNNTARIFTYNSTNESYIQSTILINIATITNGIINYNTSLVCQWTTGFTGAIRDIFIDSSNNIYCGLLFPNISTKINFYNASGNGQRLAYPYIMPLSNFTIYSVITKYSSTGQVMTSAFVQTDQANIIQYPPKIVEANSYIFAFGYYTYSLNTTNEILWNATGNKQSITDPAYTLPCPWADYGSTSSTNPGGFIIKYRVEV